MLPAAVEKDRIDQYETIDPLARQENFTLADAKEQEARRKRLGTAMDKKPSSRPARDRDFERDDRRRPNRDTGHRDDRGRY